MTRLERSLILETSGPVGRVGLASGERIVGERSLSQTRRRASDLALVVNELLKDAGWSIRTLSDVVVGLGPGSYTGLRVGLASAKALVYALGCRFHGVESFAAWAVAQGDGAEEVVVVADALRGMVYTSEYRQVGDGAWQRTRPMSVEPRMEWCARLRPGCRVVGPGVEQVRTELPSGVIVPTDASELPPLTTVLAVAGHLPWAVESDAWRAEPLYGRPSSAELQAGLIDRT